LATALAAYLVLAGGSVLAAHVDYGDTLAQDTTLDGDLVCPGSELRIGADGITLDLNGHNRRGLHRH
jgi:hypothetical protein